jgi:colanic acid/amylovoran biosynthesis protein
MTTQVLITNAYSARNRGDAAIILGMIESLRRTDVFRGAEIRISSADHPADSARYPVQVIPSFHSIKNGFSGNSSASLLFFLVVLLPLSLMWALAWRVGRFDLPLPATLRGLLQTYAGADVVIAAGGGYLYTTSVTHGNVVLLINVYSFFFAVLLGKPVCLYAQSIGPFVGSWQSWFVRRTLSRVALVEVREEVSHRLLDGWGIPTPIRMVADAAFILEARPPGECPDFVGATGGPTVGMTVRKWFRDSGRQVNYERTMAAFVDWLVDERGAEVIFLPQVTYAEGHDDDRETARNVVASVARTDRARVVEDELAVAEVKWLCGRMDFFVGTRMHSNIFALSSGVPTLAIAYQPKTEGIMAGLGLGDCVLRIEELTTEELRRAFDALVARGPEIRDHLSATLPEIRAEAIEGGRLIGEVLVGWKDRQDDAGGGR